MSMSVAEAGRRGGQAKWRDHVGPVRPYIGDLPPNQRRLILAAIEAEREKAAKQAAA